MAISKGSLPRASDKDVIAEVIKAPRYKWKSADSCTSKNVLSMAVAKVLDPCYLAVDEDLPKYTGKMLRVPSFTQPETSCPPDSSNPDSSNPYYTFETEVTISEPVTTYRAYVSTTYLGLDREPATCEYTARSFSNSHTFAETPLKPTLESILSYYESENTSAMTYFSRRILGWSTPPRTIPCYSLIHGDTTSTEIIGQTKQFLVHGSQTSILCGQINATLKLVAKTTKTTSTYAVSKDTGAKHLVSSTQTVTSVEGWIPF